MGEHDVEIEGFEREGSGRTDSNITSKQPLLRKRTNNTSQLAIVGANICPIESLDYEYANSSFFFLIWRLK